MDTYYVPNVSYGEAASGLGWLVWVGLCSLIASGCVSGPPSTVRIQPGGTHADDFDLAKPTRLTVSTFNVWGLPSWVNRASSSRFRRIAWELPQLGSDVVLLQEVWTRRCFEDLSQPVTDSYRTWWAASARRKGSFLGQNGLLTLSRYPIADARVMHFSTAHLPDSLMNKGALKTTIIAGGQRFNVWNVHLQDGPCGRVRSCQIAELIKWVQESDDGQVADIVGGDFNFTPGTREFDQLVATIGPSVHELSGDTVLPTWDGLSTRPGAGEALDHIFVRMREPVEQVHAWPRRIFTAARIEDRLSDHMGMEARLTFGTAITTPEPILTESTTAAWLETSALMHQ